MPTNIFIMVKEKVCIKSFVIKISPLYGALFITWIILKAGIDNFFIKVSLINLAAIISCATIGTFIFIFSIIFDREEKDFILKRLRGNF